MESRVPEAIEKDKLFLQKLFNEDLKLDFSSLSRTYASFRVKEIDGKKLKKRVYIDFYNDLIYCHDRDPNYLGKLDVFYFEDNDQYATKSYKKKYFKKDQVENSQSLTQIFKDMEVYKKVVPEKIYKKVTLIVEVDNGFEIDDEKQLDEKLADTFADNKSALIDSKNYEDIDWD